MCVNFYYRGGGGGGGRTPMLVVKEQKPLPWLQPEHDDM